MKQIKQEIIGKAQEKVVLGLVNGSWRRSTAKPNKNGKNCENQFSGSVGVSITPKFKNVQKRGKSNEFPVCSIEWDLISSIVECVEFVTESK